MNVEAVCEVRGDADTVTRHVDGKERHADAVFVARNRF